jgi:Heavy metal associated domain 2
MKLLLSDIASQPIEIDIISNTPGRLRLRIDREHRQIEVMNKIAIALKTWVAQIDRVRPNTNNGSLTFYYQPDSVNFAEVFNQLKAFGIIVEDLPETLSQKSFATTRLKDAIDSVDRQIQQITNNAIDLKRIVSLLLSLFVFRGLFTKNPRFKGISWFLFGWYILSSLIEQTNFSETSPAKSQKPTRSHKKSS